MVFCMDGQKILPKTARFKLKGTYRIKSQSYLDQKLPMPNIRVAQSRVSDLVRGKWEKFSLDMLITLAAREGQKVAIEMHD